MVHVQGNVHVLVGAGGNIVVQSGDEGVLVIDTGLGARGADVLAAIRRITTKPIRMLINTHAHADHSGANEALAAAGRAVSGNAPGNSGLALENARVLAHENVLKRMSAPSGQPSPRPFAAWPTETFFAEDKEIFFNDEAIPIGFSTSPSRKTKPKAAPTSCRGMAVSQTRPMSSSFATC
jgi:glyoxylase-like metal-dependent hydrolase (beta-lactamase superfamily II)